MDSIKIFTHESAKDFTKEMCDYLGLPLGKMNVMKFKNDNTFIQILETVREYYNRGGNFKGIPDKYPCVVYFGIVDYDGGRMYDEKLDWIYIGE